MQRTGVPILSWSKLHCVCVCVCAHYFLIHSFENRYSVSPLSLESLSYLIHELFSAPKYLVMFMSSSALKLHTNLFRTGAVFAQLEQC